MEMLSNGSLLRQAGLIGADWCNADDHAEIEVRNPATGDKLGAVPRMRAAETRRAIQAAAEAGTLWRAKTAFERAELLRAWFDLVLQHKRDLALLLTQEQGKPLAESLAEIDYAASYIEWYAEEARRLDGELLASPWADRRMMVTRVPVGVCAAITPWNFPAAMVTRKVAPALAAGCTIVLKPASQTPFSALALASLALQAGIPAGAFNVVTGAAAAIGAELTSSKLVAKLSFTGSTAIGRVLAAQCGPTVKKMSLELGGNAPFIVFEDADLDLAVEGAIASKFRNAGQTCVCTNRILVQRPVREEFTKKLVKAVKALRVGNGMGSFVQIGPLIDPAALHKIDGLVADATSHGARVLTGGHQHAMGGTFYTPTVIADVTHSMEISREEIFGPVAALYDFDTEDEAVAMANDTEYGLAAYYYTQDAARSWRVSERLDYGMVGVNTGLISTAAAPFGGVKQSGMGREGSRHGLHEYLQMKYTCLAVPSAAKGKK